MITGIDVVFIHVRNPKGMAEWYKEILGVEIGFQTSDLHWQELNFPPHRVPTRFGLDAIGDEATSVEKQRIMISFGVEDVYRLIESLEKKGICFFGTPKVIDAGPTLFATTQDPEGNWIQFSQKK